ncbi:MAG: ISAs1 family transposase, partial [Bacteroidota bacterium]
LLDTLMLEGATITIDAMGCQKNIFKKIVAKQADYILQVKNNQKGLLAQIEKVFSLTPGTDVHQTQELDHGRVEQRTCTVVEDLTLLDDDHGWPGLATLIRIEAQRTEKQSGKTTTSTRYYISSKKEKARIFNANIRAHWRIENNLHWMLDVLFKEDARGYSAENFSIINKMALTLIERNTDKIPKSQKIQRATYNSQYREKLLNF